MDRKTKTAVFLPIILALFSLFTALSLWFIQTPDPTVPTTPETTTPQNTVPDYTYPSAIKVYDLFIYEEELPTSLSLPLFELNGKSVELKSENGFIKIDETVYPSSIWGSPVSMYLSDLTGDGFPEICYTIELPTSGFISTVITIYDYAEERELLHIPQVLNYSKLLFMRNGVLCVQENDGGGKNILRTGALRYDGEQLVIDWDEKANYTPDAE